MFHPAQSPAQSPALSTEPSAEPPTDWADQVRATAALARQLLALDAVRAMLQQHQDPPLDTVIVTLSRTVNVTVFRWTGVQVRDLLALLGIDPTTARTEPIQGHPDRSVTHYDELPRLLTLAWHHDTLTSGVTADDRTGVPAPGGPAADLSTSEQDSDATTGGAE